MFPSGHIRLRGEGEATRPVEPPHIRENQKIGMKADFLRLKYELMF
jgi:hypothetical protein